MNIADSYRLLGLRNGASTAEVKSSYRRLARQFHPDFNPGNKQAEDKFIKLTQAYHYLIDTIKIFEEHDAQHNITDIFTEKKTTETMPAIDCNPMLSEAELKLKWQSYDQLQKFLKYKKLTMAIALVEALRSRFSLDQEVRQWQAITYQLWGKELIYQKQFDKARVYLKKALQADPQNRSLSIKVEQDLRHINRVFIN